MMTRYEKPDILRVDNLNEGVYLASGNPVRGCEGCSADDGDGCKIKKGQFADLNRNGDFRPIWEQKGKKPEDSPYYN